MDLLHLFFSKFCQWVRWWIGFIGVDWVVGYCGGGGSLMGFWRGCGGLVKPCGLCGGFWLICVAGL